MNELCTNISLYQDVRMFLYTRIWFVIKLKCMIYTDEMKFHFSFSVYYNMQKQNYGIVKNF